MQVTLSLHDSCGLTEKKTIRVNYSAAANNMFVNKNTETKMASCNPQL